MNILLILIKDLPLIMLNLLIEYRLLDKMLVKKYSGAFTCLTIFVARLLAGWLNLSFYIAKNSWESTLYYGIVSIVLYVILFNGDIIKKLFIATLILFGSPIIFYIFLPFMHYLFTGDNNKLLLSLKFLEYFATFLLALSMEYVGKKFQNLKNNLPTDYTFFLTLVVIFVHIAIISSYDRILILKDGLLSFILAFISSFFAIVGIFIVYIAIFAVDRQVNVVLKEKIQLIQLENLKNQVLEYRKFLGFRHDVNNHLVCLDTLLKNGKYSQANSYLENITNIFKELDIHFNTGNDYADAILSAKYALAISEDIDILLDIFIPSEISIDPIDLCCILSNSLDNAINECKNLAKDKKYIIARSFVSQNQFIIDIVNSKSDSVWVVNGEISPKKVDNSHGFGLENIKATVEKYNGILDISTNENEFLFSVLLPISIDD